MLLMAQRKLDEFYFGDEVMEQTALRTKSGGDLRGSTTTASRCAGNRSSGRPIRHISEVRSLASGEIEGNRSWAICYPALR